MSSSYEVPQQVLNEHPCESASPAMRIVGTHSLRNELQTDKSGVVVQVYIASRSDTAGLEFWKPYPASTKH